MIAIGSDHGGYALKQEILKHLEEKGIEYLDCGCFSEESVDYPDIAEAVCANIIDGTCDKGILLCGTGIGISMSANKIQGIRAALCHSEFDARMCREHNNANVMCLGGRTMGPNITLEMVDLFLNINFSEDPRHNRRVDKIMALENR